MNNIHSTAIVNKNAKLGSNITVSPFAIINDDVEIGDDSFIGPRAVIYKGTKIGKGVRVFHSSSIGHIPQDLKFHGENSICEIGDGTTLHEFVTIHRGTEATGKTIIGKNVFLMAYTHVAHDCVIGNNCIIANNVQIGGHVHIEDFTFIGGLTQVHQFSSIGKYCMVGGGFKVVKDVPPYVLAGEEPIKFCGLNIVGLRRRGFNSNQLNIIKDVYKILYESNLNFTQAKEKIAKDYSDNSLTFEILDFLNKSKRGILGK